MGCGKGREGFRFNKRIEFTPGQFVMTWLPGVGGEKPFSLAWRDMIVVKRVGPFTTELFKLEEGGTGFGSEGPTAMDLSRREKK